MRFQVPQFIEVEDRIFGPLTLKQFIYLIGTAGIIFILFTLLPRILALLLGAPLAGLGLALAFYKVDSRPFIVVLEAAFNYITKDRLYLWKKQDKEVRAQGGSLPAGLPIATLGESKLKNLALNLETKRETPEEDTE